MTDRGVEGGGGETRERERERGDPKRIDLSLSFKRRTGQDKTGQDRTGWKGARYVQQQQQDRNCSRQAVRQVRAAQKGTEGKEAMNVCFPGRSEGNMYSQS